MEKTHKTNQKEEDVCEARQDDIKKEKSDNAENQKILHNIPEAFIKDGKKILMG